MVGKLAIASADSVVVASLVDVAILSCKFAVAVPVVGVALVTLSLAGWVLVGVAISLTRSVVGLVITMLRPRRQVLPPQYLSKGKSRKFRPCLAMKETFCIVSVRIYIPLVCNQGTYSQFWFGL